MTWTAVERRAIYDCLRKKVRTREDAEGAAVDGLYAYPCPYSQIDWHWHLTHEHPATNPKFYVARDERARSLGGLGWPDGWVTAQIRRARILAKKRRRAERATSLQMSRDDHKSGGDASR